MRIISDIQKNLQLDNITYRDPFDYNESPYAKIKFPELGSIDLFKIVDNPYANSSKNTLTELESIAKSTHNRSQSDLDLIYTVDTDPLILFRELAEDLSINFSENIFHNMYRFSVLHMINHLKLFYNRARPYQLAEKLDINIDRIITKTHHTASYPSGHTIYAALAAEILISDYPEHKNKFNDVTKQVGLARVLQGVHYPSDNRASIEIMKTIFPNLKKYYTSKGVTL